MHGGAQNTPEPALGLLKNTHFLMQIHAVRMHHTFRENQ
jgi:hypothetical protein